MLSAQTIFFIVVFLFLIQGLTHAIVAIVLYALLTRLPVPAPGQAAVALGGAAVLLVAFAFASSQMGYALGAITLMLTTPLLIAAPLLVLSAQERYRACTGYPAIFGALFLGAATGNVLQLAYPSMYIASLVEGPSPWLFLLRMGIIGIMYIALTAGSFAVICRMQRQSAIC
ncbi:hypothetical protein AZH53_07540 [Methanomicrobiaceae archaeon CYW5]|uniref:hypothetical protein n=1 Tax=Methanovulcanius yangii TaxID=1789227 RepID=UPI0029CA6A52|nr:hypothetical protein [Methanovulcanius yangii]MBT8508255.1 hypothetical protein [Methanovulcanius yangii]